MWSRTRVLGVVVPVVAVAAGMRLFHLGYHDLRGDEAFSIFFAQQSWQDIVSQLRTGEPHPPLYYLALNFWMRVAGSSEFAARWPSAAGNIALVPLMFVAGRRLASPLVGLIAAALVAANPFQIWNSQDGRMYTLATTFTAAVLYFGLRAMDVGQPARSRDAWGLALAALLALSTHYVTAPLVAAVYGTIVVRWLLVRRPGARSMRSIAMAGGLAATIYVPWLVVGLPVLGPGYGGNVQSPGIGDAAREVLESLSIGDHAAQPAAWLAAAAFAAAALAGAVVVFRRQRPAGTLLLGAFVFPFLALFAASLARPVFSPRYLLVISPAIYLLVALGLVGLTSSVPRRVARVATGAVAAGLAAIIVSLTGIVLQGYYADRWGEGPGGWQRYVRSVIAAAGAKDLIVVNHLDPAFFYYYKRLGGRAETIVAPPRADANDADLDNELQGLMKAGRAIWLVPDGAHQFDKKGIVTAWLQRHTRRQENTSDGLELDRFRVPDIASRGEIFGDVVRLEGYETSAGERAPGGEIEVTLVWQAVTPVYKDYVVTLQLLDEQGRLVGQNDGQPAAGRAPTSTWRTTERVVDGRTIKLPEVAGSYSLGVAVYELPSVQRLAIAGTTTNLVTLETIRVGR